MVNKCLLGWAETMDTERNFNKRQFARFLRVYRASLKTQLIKNLPALQEIPVQFLGWEDPLEKGKDTHSSILAWRISWTV